MARVTPLDTSPSLDEDIRALMEDIDASMSDFEQRLEAERIPKAQQPVAAQEKIPLPQPKLPPKSAEQPTLRSEPVSLAKPSAPADAPPLPGGLLAELAREAKKKDEEQTKRQAVNQKAIHDALDRLYRYLDTFCRHVNVLAPAIDRSYRFDDKTIFTKLRWQDANVKSRKNGLSEQALLDFVAFRVRLTAPGPLTVTVKQAKLETFKKDTHLYDLRAAEGMDIEGIGGSKEESVIRLAPDFPVQLNFTGNYETGRIDVMSRNLETFGISAFACQPEDITQEFLDDLGRFLICRSNSLPPALRRTHHRAGS